MINNMNKYGIKQLGFIVKDAEKAAELYGNLFGIGPWEVFSVEPDRIDFRGHDDEPYVRIAEAQQGDVQIELIELQGPNGNFYSEFGRYGLHHFQMWVDDLQAARKAFEDAGYKIATTVYIAGTEVYTFDLRDDFGCYVELMEPMEEGFNHFIELAAEWDGSEPMVRVLDKMPDEIA